MIIKGCEVMWIDRNEDVKLQSDWPLTYLMEEAGTVTWPCS